MLNFPHIESPIHVPPAVNRSSLGRGKAVRNFAYALALIEHVNMPSLKDDHFLRHAVKIDTGIGNLLDVVRAWSATNSITLGCKPTIPSHDSVIKSKMHRDRPSNISSGISTHVDIGQQYDPKGAVALEE